MRLNLQDHSNLPHTSYSDARNHITLQLATQAQGEEKKHQVAHVHVDEKYIYQSHQLYPEVIPDNKEPVAETHQGIDRNDGPDTQKDIREK